MQFLGRVVVVGCIFLFITACESGGPKIIEKKYPSGEIRERYTVGEDGKMQGLYEQLYPNGERKVSTMYKNGKKHGQSTTFYANGRTESNVFYKEGSPYGRAVFNYDSGLLRKEENYSEESELMWAKSYYPSGKLMKDIAYRTTNGAEFASVTYSRDGAVIPAQSNFVAMTQMGPYSFEAKLHHKDLVKYDSIRISAVKDIHPLERSSLKVLHSTRFTKNPFRYTIQEEDYAGYTLNYLIIAHGKDAEGNRVEREFRIHWGKSEVMPRDNIRPIMHD